MGATKPFFSIVTCTLNAEKYLKSNIHSVSSQNFENYEHIFIDGFSTDKTYQLLKEYKKRNPGRVRLRRYPPKGIWNAINLGTRLAQGTYIIHLEADNFFHDKRVLPDTYKFLAANPEYDWVYGKIRVIERNNRVLGIFPNRKIFQLGLTWLLTFFNYIPQEAMFIKKEVFKKYGHFKEYLSTSMDYDMWLRIKDKTKWKFFNRIITDYRIRHDAISSSEKNREINLENLLKVQRRRVHKLIFPFCRVITLLIDRQNKFYRSN